VVQSDAVFTSSALDGADGRSGVSLRPGAKPFARGAVGKIVGWSAREIAAAAQ